MIFKIHKRKWIIFCLLLIIISGSWWIVFSHKTDLDNGIGVQEDAYHTVGEQSAFEWWYFDGTFTDGTSFVIFWNINTNSGKSFQSISVSLSWPNGENYYYVFNDANASFEASKDQCKIKFGNNTLAGDLNQYRIHLENFGDISKLDLTLNKTVPSWRTGNNPFYFGNTGKYAAWLPAVPRGTIEGNMVFKNETKKIVGLGYHDHNWYNLTPAEYQNIFGYRYWGRAMLGDYTVIFDQNVAQKEFDSKSAGSLFVTKGDKIIYQTYMSPTDLSFEKKGNDLEVYFKNTDKEIKLTVSQDRDITPSSGQNNSYQRYLGQAKLEITIGEQKEEINGQTIWEYANNNYEKNSENQEFM